MAASKSSIFKSFLRYSPILLTALAFAYGYYLIYVHGPELSGRLLKELVSRQSDDQYEINYSKLDISIINKGIEIDQLILSPVPDTLKRVYQIKIPKLEITLKSLLDIYLDRTLSFQRILIYDPQIQIIRTARDRTQTTFSVESGDLYQLIQENLFKLAIDSFAIKNASIDYHSMANKELRILLKELDFGASKFSLDSASQGKQFFYSENITLRLTNQHFNLGDSIHEATLEALDISTGSRNILFKNFQLKPRSSHNPKEKANLYHLNIPEFNFRGLDFQEAYSSNSLKLDSVRLSSPTISVTRSTSTKQKRDLLPSVFKLFSRMKIGKMFIDDGTFLLENNGDFKHVMVKSEKLNMEIDNFEVDSSYLINPLERTYFDQFKLTASNTELITNDSSNHLRLKHFNASSSDSTLQLSEFQFKNTNSKSKNNYTIKIPDFFLDGIDFKRAWLRHEINGNEIEINNPYIAGTLSLKQYNSSEPFINQVSLKGISITDGELNLTVEDKQVNIADFDIDLKSIDLDLKNSSINNLHNNWFTSKLNLTNCDFLLSNRSFQIGSIKTDSNFYRSKIYNISQHQNEKTPLRADTILIDGLLLDSLFNSGFVIFDSLTVHGPHFVLDLDKPQSLSQDRINDLIHRVFFNQVRIDRGHVNVIKNGQVISHMDSISTTLSTFHYDTIIGEYFTGIDFHADTIHVSFADLHHGLSGSNISISQKDSTLDIQNLVFLPYNLDSAFNHYKIISEELKLRQLNFHRLINDQEIQFVNGFLQHPDIDIIIETKSSTTEKAPPKDLISFESFNIGSGNLHFANNTTGFRLTSLDFDVLVHDFDMLNDSNLFYAKNYLFDAKQTVIGMQKLHDSIRIGYSLINTSAGNFTFNEFTYRHGDMFDLSFPKIDLRGLVTDHLIERGTFKMDSITLTKPLIKYGIQANPSKPSNPPNIEIGKLKVNDGTVRIHKNEWNHGDTINLQALQLNINDFIYDSLIRVEFSHHLFSSLDISGSDLSYTLPDSLFQLRLGQYTYDHTDKHVELNDFELIPLYNRGEFQTKIDYQKDWLEGSVSNIYFTGFEIDSLISKNLFKTSKIQIDSFILDTHRDKRLPREDGVFKPLPQSLLEAAPLRIIVDSIIVNNAFVSHSEFSETGEFPGKIYFQNIDAALANVTNDTVRITKIPVMHFDATGLLMKTGDFTLGVDFDLTSKNDRYTLMGNVGSMDLTELNEFLEYTAFVEVRSGQSKSVDFSFEANNTYALGEMTFYYDDLKISVLNQESYDTKGFGASLKTFFANTFVVNTKNPHFIFVRDGHIFHERDQSKSIFNYWGKSLLNGVVSSIGAKNNKKEIKNQNEEIRLQYENRRKKK